MTPDKFRDLIVARLAEKRDICLTSLASQKYRPSAVIGGQGDQAIGAVAGSTAEELAMALVDHNARISAFTAAIADVNEIYRQALQPDGEEKPESPIREAY